LNHPNLVVAYDAREEAGFCFLVMEFVEGLDLSRLLERRGRLPVPDACEVVRQATMGLDYAHRACGLVHRDIKPSNLMITPTGCVKILDLGISQIGTSAGLQSASVRWGTADYMAPEQCLMSHRADIRTDIYSLGCTLYELLAGHAPYARPDWATRDEKMLAHALVPPPPIQTLRPDVPAALAALLDRLLAKQPADRYDSLEEVTRGLEAFTKGHNLPALIPPPEFVPTVPIADPAANGEGRTAGAKPRWWRPRGDWSNPPKFSKPIVIPVVLVLMTVLLLAYTIANPWRSGDRVRGTKRTSQDSLASRGLELPARVSVGAELAVQLYRSSPDPGDFHYLGRIGAPHRGAFLGQWAVVEAVFDEPMFPYLIAVHPDGTCQSLFPEASTDSGARQRLVYPALNKYLKFNQSGLVGLIVLGSRCPLSIEAQRPPEVDPVQWKQGQPNIPWYFDGERCDPMSSDREGGFTLVSHGPRPFARLCEDFQSRPEIATVRGLAFPVKQPSSEP
jgi:hypothetical protein